MCVAFAKVGGLEERLAAVRRINIRSSGSGRDMRSAQDASLGIVQATLHTAQRAILSSGGALRQSCFVIKGAVVIWTFGCPVPPTRITRAVHFSRASRLAYSKRSALHQSWCDLRADFSRPSARCTFRSRR